METKIAAHTPGPWRWQSADGFIVDGNGDQVAEIPCQGCNPDHDGPLLAASPRLLEVSKETSARLKECITVKELTGQDPAFLLQLVKDMWQKLDAAIREAESPEQGRGAELRRD